MKSNLPIFLFFILIFATCTNNVLEEPFNCDTVTIAVSLITKQDASACGSADGRISVSASGGEGAYTFSINGGTFSSSSLFENLTSGTYSIQAKDSRGCVGTLLPSPTIAIPNSDLSLALNKGNDTDCLTNNGTIAAEASGGQPPYSYRLGTGTFSSTNNFNSLAPGTYTITVKDDDNCTFSSTVVIAREDTGVSWSGEISTIINTSCATSGCHDGSRSPNLSTLAGVQANKARIKSETTARTMPPSSRTPLSAEQILKISCWVDDGGKSN